MSMHLDLYMRKYLYLMMIRQRKQQCQGKEFTVEQERAGQAHKNHRHKNTPFLFRIHIPLPSPSMKGFLCSGAFHTSATKSLPHRGRLHRIAMTEGVVQQIQSASARSYLSASACMVPSAFSASKASSTAAAASLLLRNATPYSSAFSSSTIFRSA